MVLAGTVVVLVVVPGACGDLLSSSVDGSSSTLRPKLSPGPFEQPNSPKTKEDINIRVKNCELKVHPFTHLVYRIKRNLTGLLDEDSRLGAQFFEIQKAKKSSTIISYKSAGIRPSTTGLISREL